MGDYKPRYTVTQPRKGIRFVWLPILLISLALLIAGSIVFYYTILIFPAQETPSTLYRTITSKTPSLADSLNGGQAARWDTYSYAGGRCIFANGTLHAQLSPAQPLDPPASIFYLSTCRMHNTSYTNIAFQVQMTAYRAKRLPG